ncbi:helix-turn-helix domain-containing protein [Streptomyces lushanensis]|uniref:AraC-like ligand-binding domain-containing protein n=1 Tax=Streptomyces lushanensis TaxID=1434255 RepID=UPI00082EEB71|nr:helix-turn-helix domain-containing protein [Streptomyces lushanensis]
MVTEFRTVDVPVEDRFDYWCQLVGKTMVPVDMDSDHAADYRGEMRVLGVGAASVWPVTTQPVRLRRTPRLIRQHDPELYRLLLPQRGTLEVTQVGRQAAHGSPDMTVTNTWRPFDLRYPEPVTVVGLEVPRRLLSLPEARVEGLLSRRLPAQEGIGALLAGFLTTMSRDSASYGPSDGPRLETVLVDLLSAMLAHHLEEENRLSPETRGRTLVLRVRAFVQQHLHEPELSPASIASAHHISVSYLHRLFRTEGVTVAAWIRQERLARARRDLGDPLLRNVPVHQIGARWGFLEATAFSRAFRTAYGLPPRDYRHQTLGAP